MLSWFQSIEWNFSLVTWYLPFWSKKKKKINKSYFILLWKLFFYIYRYCSFRRCKEMQLQEKASAKKKGGCKNRREHEMVGARKGGRKKRSVQEKAGARKGRSKKRREHEMVGARTGESTRWSVQEKAGARKGRCKNRREHEMVGARKGRCKNRMVQEQARARDLLLNNIHFLYIRLTFDNIQYYSIENRKKKM